MPRAAARQRRRCNPRSRGLSDSCGEPAGLLSQPCAQLLLAVPFVDAPANFLPRPQQFCVYGAKVLPFRVSVRLVPARPARRHGEVPEALAAAAGLDLKDGTHPRPPMQMPSGLDKALVGFSFPTYDRKASRVRAHPGRAPPCHLCPERDRCALGAMPTLIPAPAGLLRAADIIKVRLPTPPAHATPITVLRCAAPARLCDCRCAPPPVWRGSAATCTPHPFGRASRRWAGRGGAWWGTASYWRLARRAKLASPRARDGRRVQRAEAAAAWTQETTGAG